MKMLERAGGEFIDEEETAGVDGASVDGERGEAATSVPPSRGWLIDLTARAPEEVSPLVGRESELKQLKTCLLRKNKGSVVVLGMPGVGKTSFVLELARQIAQDQNVPPGIRGTAVYDVPLGRLRDSARGMADIERVGREMLTKPGRPLFFLDEIHQLVDPVFQPLRELLKPPLANGSLRVIGATTPIEWHQVRDQAFKRRFVELVLREPSPSDAVEMVKAWVAALASHHELDISEAVVREAVMLAARYLPSRQFPDKAIDLLDQAASLQRMSEAGHDAAVGDSDAGT
ncbi:MAG: ATP-dependent Clp protease ATP-binding subunit [Planctomycetaceae bacterium]|nr:ATP-dependent Clp protease ATP-binding subunit [Planctomycetaceae bacterium]